MKIRVDFVTNSSSSSFSVVKVTTKGNDYYLVGEEENGWDRCNDIDIDKHAIPAISDGKMVLDNEEINDLLPLIKNLLMISYPDELDELLADLCANWLIHRMDSRTFVEKLREYYAKEWKQEVFLFSDYEDYETEEELREYILDNFEDEGVLEVRREDLEPFIDFCDNVTDFKDVLEINIRTGMCCRDEDIPDAYFPNDMEEEFEKKFGQKFHALNEEDPDFNKTVEEWYSFFEGLPIMIGADKYKYKDLYAENMPVLYDIVEEAAKTGNIKDIEARFIKEMNEEPLIFEWSKTLDLSQLKHD